MIRSALPAALLTLLAACQNTGESAPDETPGAEPKAVAMTEQVDPPASVDAVETSDQPSQGKPTQLKDVLGNKAGKAEAALKDAGQKVVASAEQAVAEAAGFYGLSTQTLDGQPVDLSAYAGKVCLVVNVASKCGYTRQYAGLQKLYEDHADEGLVVLGFPSNEFGGQEPGTPAEIAQFCSSTYGVDFPMFAKCQVKDGPQQSPVFAFLEDQTGKVPQWNFTKYLVGPTGSVLAVFPSKVEPDSVELAAALTKALGAS